MNRIAKGDQASRFAIPDSPDNFAAPPRRPFAAPFNPSQPRADNLDQRIKTTRANALSLTEQGYRAENSPTMFGVLDIYKPNATKPAYTLTVWQDTEYAWHYRCTCPLFREQEARRYKQPVCKHGEWQMPRFFAALALVAHIQGGLVQ